MYIIDKFLPIKLSSVLLTFFFFTIFTSPVAAVDLPFDPNDFTFLIYNPLGSEASIIGAMKIILGRDLDSNEIRDRYNEVTPNDLSTHDILIVGWNYYGYTSGLDDEILEAGITGRVILSGHDADYHTVNGPNSAEVFLVQAIDWVLKGDGTGMITLGCTSAFPYLPEFWDVNASTNVGEGAIVTEFTEEGLASGVYDDLEPNKMSGWGQSYHDIFTIGQYPYFVPFELGGYSGSDIITIACDKFKLPYFYINKDANEPNCVFPGDYITYKITYGPKGVDHNNVVITDYLPCQVDYINPFDPNYDDVNHTYKWQIGSLSASAPNDFVTLTVYVNLGVEPNGIITNYCEIESDQYFSFASEDTNVCSWSPDIIYVDLNAVGCNSGLSWYHADTDLQSALRKAQEWDVNQIWVAEGSYMPTMGSDRSISFELLDNVAIYGGFAGTESHPDQRDLTDPNNETILSGDIGTPVDQNDNSYHVVKCENVNNAVLDGFTITAGNADATGFTDPNQFGGGICCKNSSVIKAANCTITQNEAIYGGGIYNYNLSSLTITNCSFSYNSAFHGGTLYNDYSSSDVNITNCVFTGNTAEYYGGGIYNYQSSPALTNCAFSENHAVGYTFAGDTYGGIGGGIANYQSSPTLINCTFSGNSALVSSGNKGKGGAIYNTYDSSPAITNCVFSGNLSDAIGGGIYNESSDPNITNCIFSGNKANVDGGGVYNTSSSPNMTNCIFIGNTADSYGGGMHDHNCPLVAITNSIFSGNSSNYGGGISNDYSDPNIINCIFSGNKANNDGGGMYNKYCSSVAVANCIFSGNSAEYGGGITDYNCGVTLTNCTFSENWADYGGGMYNAYSNVNLINSILWANEAYYYDEIYNYSTNLIVVYCDVNGGWAGDGNIDKDPCFFEVEPPDGSWTEDASYDSSTFQSTLTDSDANWAVNQLAGKFVNPYTSQALQFFIVSNDVYTIKVWSDVTAIAGNGDTYQIYDYHLRVESACIDRGYPDGDYTGHTDIDGEPRVFDGDYNEVPIVDMGADEYYWSPADFNSDGFVNFFDYAFFASAWQTDPNDPNYNEDCDLEDNNFIDYKDIALFCEDWLWQTAWAKAFPSNYGRGMGKSMGMGETFFPSIEAEKALPELTAADIEEILKWLAELWLTDEEVRKMITEDEWLKFTESVKQVLKELINN